jgi:thioesterase domain-containing protein/acyl carrier protein
MSIPLKPSGVPTAGPTNLGTKIRGTFVPPGDPLQVLLVELWEDSLGLRPVGIRDNFFELGGDSLLAADMLMEAEALLGAEIAPEILLAGATIEQLAAALIAENSSIGRPRVVEVQKGSPEGRFFYLHGDFNGGGFYCVNLARHLGKDQGFYTLPPHGLAGLLVPATIGEMAADQLKALIEFQPHGPYRLGGHCNGALVAFDMARQLCLRGEQVEALVLISPGLAALPTPVVNRSPVVDLSPLTLEHRRQALLQLYWKACADYFPQPYPGRISVLYSADEAREDRPKYDWKRVAKDVEIRQVPGRHLTMLTQHIQGLAREVKECLKPATRASPESANG